MEKIRKKRKNRKAYPNQDTLSGGGWQCINAVAKRMYLISYVFLHIFGVSFHKHGGKTSTHLRML